MNRNNIIPSTTAAIMSLPPDPLRRGVQIHFEGEDGFDKSGVTKESLDLFAVACSRPASPLFVCHDGSMILSIKPYIPEDTPEIRTHFHAFDRVITLALWCGETFPVQLSEAILKSLLSIDVTLAHLAADIPETYSTKVSCSCPLSYCQTYSFLFFLSLCFSSLSLYLSLSLPFLFVSFFNHQFIN